MHLKTHKQGSASNLGYGSSAGGTPIFVMDHWCSWTALEERALDGGHEARGNSEARGVPGKLP